MKEGRHAEAQRMMFDGTIAKNGYTSVWTKHHVNPSFMRCDACGKINRGAEAPAAAGRNCRSPVPYW